MKDKCKSKKVVRSKGGMKIVLRINVNITKDTICIIVIQNYVRVTKNVAVFCAIEFLLHMLLFNFCTH